MALQSANHTVIGIVNTMQCHMIHQLVWYAHFIFYSELFSQARSQLQLQHASRVNNTDKIL